VAREYDGGMAERCVSKSKYLDGLKCQKLLWYAYNAKEEIPEADEERQAIFDQGREVGNLAKKLFPDGIEVGEGIFNLAETIRLTNEAVKSRKPLFEAAFSAEGGYCRVDILNPVGKSEWDIIEVKSSSSAKDVHLQDLAFQAWVLTKAGLKIRRSFLMHINSEYVRKGAIDPKKFFTQEDLTVRVAELSRGVEPDVADMLKTVRRRDCPEIEIGPHCDAPYACALKCKCWAFLPEASVFTLYRGGRRSFELLRSGIERLAKIPTDYALTNNQTIQREALLTGKPHIDRAAVGAFLKQIEYPASYLDFETFTTAIPQFDELSPYQQVPFQFSLHVVRSNGAEPGHHSFLTEGRDDPRPEFMRQLREALPVTGSVVVYNAKFELGRLEECCEVLPEFKPWFKKVESRVVDLLLPFRGFRYYHPKQNGSASMKAVLPALTARGYEGLAIQEGGEASREFLRVTFGYVSKAERVKVRKQLEAYCGLDTMGMIEIVTALKRAAGVG